MNKIAIFILSLFSFPAFAVSSDISQTARSQDVINDFFGKQNDFSSPPKPVEFDFGGIGAGASTRLSCGNVNLISGFDSYIGEISSQLGVVMNTIKKIPTDAPDYAVPFAMLTLCYMNPPLCDQVRNFQVDLSQMLKFRFDTCKSIDDYVDKRADQGSQMVAEAKAECVNGKVKSGVDMAVAVSSCDSQSTFNVRDFNGQLKKQFTGSKQKTLLSMVNFSQSSNYYDFIEPILGEVEVQNDGYYSPIFDKGMLKPYDAAKKILAQAQDDVCTGSNLKTILTSSSVSSSDKIDEKLKVYIRSKVTVQDYNNLQILRSDEKDSACNALARVVAKEAGHDLTSEARSVVASGLNNPNIPQDLKNEYDSRSKRSFNEVDHSLDNFEYRSLDEVQKNLALLANATIRDNQMTSSSMSRHKSLEDVKEGKPCTDVLSCLKKGG